MHNYISNAINKEMSVRLRTTIQIPASSIAALCGRHRHLSSDEALWRVISSYNPAIKARLLTKYGKADKAESTRVTTLCRTLEGKLKVTKEHRDIVVADTITDVLLLRNRNRVKRLMDEHDDKNKNEKDKRMMKQIQERLATYSISSRGMLKELTTRRELRRSGYDVRRNPVEYRKSFGRMEIRGIVDGIRYDKGTAVAVVEIKNRVRGFWTPGYDLDQLAVYVVLTGLSAGDLVQRCDGKICTQTYRRTELLERWKQMFNRLRIVLTKLDKYLFSAKCNEGREFVNKQSTKTKFGNR